MKEGDLTYRIIGCAMNVHSELGPGLREKPYENALTIEFDEQEMSFLKQPEYPILYHGIAVGECRPDFLVQNEVIVECKSISGLGENEMGQMLNYLRIIKKKVGLILNFHGVKLEIKRVVL